MCSALVSTHWLDEQGTLHVQRDCFSNNMSKKCQELFRVVIKDHAIITLPILRQNIINNYNNNNNNNVLIWRT